VGQDGLSEDYYFEELPLVLSATRLSQPREDIPAAITIIDRDMIRASGAMNVPDLLRLVPGMVVGFYSGSRATASYHGLADEYARDMQVLVDGRSIYDPGFGGVSWPDMPIEMDEIARIEVIRGPNAAAYGSNAFAGVINIVSEHPADQPGTSAKAILGEGDSRSLYARHADIQGKWAYRVSAKYREFGGFDNIPDNERTQWLTLHGDYTPDSRNNLQVILGASNGNYQEGFNEVAQQVRRLDNRHHFEQLNWQHWISPDNELALQFYHNFFEIDDHFQSPPLSQVVADATGADPDLLAQSFSFPNFASFLGAINLSDAPLGFSFLGFKSHRYDLELQQTLSDLGDFRLVWGLGLRQDSVQGPWLFHTDERITRDQGRVFGNLEWRIRADLVANIGGMLERFEKKRPVFSPRLALNYHLDASNTLRIETSRAYRMPTLYEDFVNQVIFLNGPFDDLDTWRKATRNLDPQRIDSFELGYLGNFPRHGLTLDVRLFREHLTNIIDEFRDLGLAEPTRGLSGPRLALLQAFVSRLDRQGGGFTFDNTADAVIRGVELDLKIKPTRRDSIYLGYSYLHAEGTELRRTDGGIPDFTSDQLGSAVPDHTFSLLASHRFDGGFLISSAFYFMDDLNWPGDGDEVPSFNRWDLRLGKSFRTAGMDGELSLLLQNLGEQNTDFFEDEQTGQINIWDRRAFLQAIVNFH